MFDKLLSYIFKGLISYIVEDVSGPKCAVVLKIARLYMQGLYKALNIPQVLDMPQ